MNNLKCVTCQGQGKTICNQCHGVGSKRIPYLGVFQTTKICETCVGTGFIECADCQGSGMENDLSGYHQKPIKVLPAFEERMQDYIEEKQVENINILRLISENFELQQWILDVEDNFREYWILRRETEKKQESLKNITHLINNLSMELHKRDFEKESIEILDLKLLKPKLNDDQKPIKYTVKDFMQDNFDRWVPYIEINFKKSQHDAQRIVKLIDPWGGD